MKLLPKLGLPANIHIQKEFHFIQLPEEYGKVNAVVYMGLPAYIQTSLKQPKNG
jgi:hypothetical protein